LNGFYADISRLPGGRETSHLGSHHEYFWYIMIIEGCHMLKRILAVQIERG
jgi:hypothetical protein